MKLRLLSRWFDTKPTGWLGPPMRLVGDRLYTAEGDVFYPGRSRFARLVIHRGHLVEERWYRVMA